MSTIFEQLTQAVEDHDTLWMAFRSSAQAAADITAATAARLADERAQVDARTATLTTQSRDPARPAVVRKLAAQEIDRLQERTFEPSVDETAAFAAAMQDAEAALRDFTATEIRLRDLFEQASGELKTMRAGTLGSGPKDPELARRHLDGEQKAFDRLGKTGRPGGLVREDGGSSE